MTDKHTVKKLLIESAAVKTGMILEQPKVIAAIAQVMLRAVREGHKIIWFGNGGSAADAQHLAAELVGKFEMGRAPIRSIALTTNTSILTAVANDMGFEQIFSRQLEACVEKGDIAVGISTSGKSPNVLLGLETARKYGAITVGFTGRTGAKTMKRYVDYLLAVPSDSTPRIQEAHITAGHIICYLLEKELFG